MGRRKEHFRGTGTHSVTNWAQSGYLAFQGVANDPVNCEVVLPLFQFKCCGVHDYRDWRNESSYFKDRTSKVPVACCENAATNGLAASIDDCLDKPEKFANDSVMQGCISQFLKAYETAEKLLFYISLGAIVLLVNVLDT